MDKINKIFRSVLFLIPVAILSGCATPMTTHRKDLNSFVTPVSQKHEKIMIVSGKTTATKLSGQVTSSTRGYNYTVIYTSHQFSRSLDTQFNGFVNAIRKSGVAGTIVGSPVSGGSVPEYLYLAKKQGIKYLIITQLESTPHQINMNSHLGWIIVFSLTIVFLPLLAVLNPVNYRTDATINIDIWNVGENVRVFKKAYTGTGWSKGWDSASAKIRHVTSSVEKAVNDAYTRAIPEVIQFVHSLQ